MDPEPVENHLYPELSYNDESKDEAHAFCKAGLSAIYTNNCQNPYQILNLFKIIERFDLSFRFCFLSAYDTQKLEYILSQAMRLKMSLKIRWTYGEKLTHLVEHYTDLRVIDVPKNPTLQVILVVFGCRQEAFREISGGNLPNPVDICVSEGRKNLLNVLLNIGCGKSFPDEALEFYESQVLKKLSLMEYELYDDEISFRDSNRKRLTMVFEMVYGLATEDNIQSQIMECVELMYRHLPDVPVTLGEIVAAFMYMYTGEHTKDILTFMDKKAVKSFYDLVAAPVPRNLAHYCRCTIRNRLLENSQLSRGIHFLNLPRELVSYLRLES